MFVKGCGNKNMEIRFKLNVNNEKDKKIIDMLENEYNPNMMIKSILYKMTTDNNLKERMLSEGNKKLPIETIPSVITEDDGIDEGNIFNEFSEYFG